MAPPLARIRRGLLAALVTAAVALPVAGAAGPAEVPAPAPPPTTPLTAGTPAELTARLDARYADRRAALRAAERTADAYGARRRATALHAMAEPGRRFLAFDGRDGGRSAVIAWLGYRTPTTAGAASLTPGRAEQAAPALTASVAELHRIRPTARITLLCHSYGSVVCARAAAGTPAAAIVLYGSPGTGHDDVAALHTRATVWAGRAADDWVARVPHVRIPLPSLTRSGSELGFGADPTDPAFGARRFAAGDGGHSDYLAPGSVPLRNLARIVEGEEPADA